MEEASDSKTGYLKANWLIGLMCMLIFTLMGYAWNEQTRRISALEEWRKERDASRDAYRVTLTTKVSLLEQKLDTQLEKIAEIKRSIEHLEDDDSIHRKRGRQ